MRFENRAERITTKQVAETFVAVGPLLDLLSSRNNQIMYGRRGTGKTHALRYFQNVQNSEGHLAIYIDAQNIGSNGSIYNDTELPLAERSTRLLVDICTAIHAELLDIFTDPAKGWDLSTAAPILDRFVDVFTETRIDGQIERTSESAVKNARHFEAGLSGALSATDGLSLNAKAANQSANERSETERQTDSGKEASWIDFSYFARAIRELASFIERRRLWILIDEWTTVPPDIQPYLADLLRRAMFSVPNITVKIAAIEHRSTFKLDLPNEGYIGLELGADIHAAINLDDYLVIDNDEERAKNFFRTFIENHAASVASEIDSRIDLDTLITAAFTQDNVFTEFVRATEGVPRDAMHLLSLAAQKASSGAITMPIIRTAAYSFFQTEKYNTIQSNQDNRLMLDWIRDEVIGKRRTRAFLLPVGTKDAIIDRLFDRRALHILNRNRSAAHRPGERFVVYKMDYGLYIDLAATDKFPTGTLFEGNDEIEVMDIDVPLDDARSFRRAILDLEQFYASHDNVAKS